jgi:hypothetical protein
MERDDIVVNPKDKQTLYFSQRLQEAVLNAMQPEAAFSELFTSLHKWILMRLGFEGERQAVAGGGSGGVGRGVTEAAPDHGESPDHLAKSRQKGNSDAGHGDKGADSDGKKDDMQEG